MSFDTRPTFDETDAIGFEVGNLIVSAMIGMLLAFGFIALMKLV